MLTINYLIQNKVPLSHKLTDEDKSILLDENKGQDISYLSLMREMFGYGHITVQDLIQGWGGVKIVNVNK